MTLRGFKSFADKTTLALEPGISIIVGPNGSGKSNVIDAISWVLGEQGPRSLRGGRMEDVIFAGTQRRPALAMAEVSLTIDNTAGDLPLEFTEVTITRTLFRSGEAEYRLNGLPCRLLDIREVLSDGGIGREQHTIIGQGHLDEMLTADPIQIRASIEEAAGVAKHRRRKERALRRIAATDANLVRISDVLSEVRRLLRPLREQAEIAKRHASVVEELERIQVILAARELGEIRRRLGPDGAVDLEGPIRAAELDVAALDATLAEAGRRRAEAAGRTERGREVAWSLNRLAERLRSLARLAHERDRSLSAELAGITEAGAQARLDELARELAGAEPLLEEAAAAAESAEARVATRREALAQAEATLSGVQARVLPLRNAQREAQGIVVQARGELATLMASMEAAEAEQGRADERRRALDEARRRALAALEESRVALAELEAAEAPHVEVIAELEERLETAEQERQAGLSALADAEREAATWRARAQVRDGASPEAARRIAASGLLGVIGVLSDLVQITPASKAALEALVGPAGSVLVVEDAAAAERALQAAGAGEPLGILVASGADAPMLGGRPLADLLRPISGPAAAALAGVYLARGAAEAARLAGEHPEAVFVTLDGVMATGRLLVSTSAAAGARAAEAEAQLAGARDHLSAVEAEIAALRRTFGEAASVLNRADADIAAASDRAASAERELHALDREAGVMDEGSQRTADSTSTLAGRITDLERGLLEAQARADAAARELETYADEQVAAARVRGEAAGALDEARLAAARAAERHRLLVERCGELRSALERAAAEAAKIGGRRADLAARLERARSVFASAGILGDGAGVWAAEAEEVYRACGRATAEADAAVSGLQERRASLVGAVDALRERARTEGLAAAELRIRSRIIEERWGQEGRDVEALVERFGQRLEDEDPTSLMDPWDRSAAAEDEALQRRQARLDRDLAAMGRVNPLAAAEFEALTEREQFLTSQIADVRTSRRDLLKVVAEVDDRIRELFLGAFSDVAREYEHVFSTLFPGGVGRLRLTDPADVLETGVEVEARPGGKNLRRLSLLSGGERALAGLALAFAIFRARPSPFYVLDEVEAALDDVNLHRFLGLLREFRTSSQLIVVTHQKRTMELADILYGISVRSDGASRVISERLRSLPGSPEGIVGRDLADRSLPLEN
ncbi:MAG: smc [Actinobacteria bacterium]|nr:smc [Actinomycetota bacterium]